MLDVKIYTFLKVVELKSYTMAADSLCLTQPAVTQHIKKLEEFYGCRLIDSSGHAVKLTKAGEMLYQYMCFQNANQKQLQDQLQNLSRSLQIGATLSIADYYLPQTLTGSLLKGNMNFSVLVGNTERLLLLLLNGKLDCAFIEGIFDSSLFESHIFREAPIRPIVAIDHPLAGKEVAFHQLHAYPLALREPGSGTRELLNSYLYQHHDSISSFSHIMELGSFVLVKQLVSHSHAISFVYEAVASEEVKQGKLCFLSVKDYDYSHPLHFIYRKGSPNKHRYEDFYQNIQTVSEGCPS